jgi:hypothetical protein
MLTPIPPGADWPSSSKMVERFVPIVSRIDIFYKLPNLPQNMFGKKYPTV